MGNACNGANETSSRSLTPVVEIVEVFPTLAPVVVEDTIPFAIGNQSRQTTLSDVSSGGGRRNSSSDSNDSAYSLYFGANVVDDLKESREKSKRSQRKHENCPRHVVNIEEHARPRPAARWKSRSDARKGQNKQRFDA
mmetsp:Transcript_85386/g.133424  ORF Transcript_85386/g.133424 Transcript_85386/m.133424 type:complete len:138 (-) Transcript_85386:174-587(-)